MAINDTQGDTSKKGSDPAHQLFPKTANFIQSENHRDLLDIVDKLRSRGVSHYVDLPQIIVCGSQSSGKSSTLESLSGISFPTSEGLCTRFATELILRRGDNIEISVHINPGAGRTEKERVALAAFAPRTSDRGNIGKIIESAKSVMGLSGEGAKVFSADVLRIELVSPDQPNLTIVDLPGLFGASDKNQTDDDSAMVQNLVTSYMKQRRSIILAVVSADNAFANQPVTKFARDIDPSGTRTLGLITKPDKIDKGSDSERYYVELAENRNVKLTLGWHVLRNKGLDTLDDTPEQRDKREISFFAESAWSELDPKHLGAENLRQRLREVLWNQIRQGLPGVKSDVQTGILDCQVKLEQLGSARDSRKAKQKYLLYISSRLTKLIRAGIDGVYADRFFKIYPGQQDGFERRLRANIQKILAAYSAEMSADGHALEVVEDDLMPKRISRYVYRSSYLNTVKKAMEECRGRELPGTYNPLVVGQLFGQQCQPWQSISQKLVELIHEAAAVTFSKLLSEICDGNTKGRLMKGMIQPALYSLRRSLKDMVSELLEPHLSIHPITYNEFLTDTVHKIQAARHKRNFYAVSREACGFDTETAVLEENDIPLLCLLRALLTATEPDPREYAASLCADVAAAYYKVALKKFVDDVSVNAVETCLIQQLPDVFSPEVVWDLEDDQIDDLGVEDDNTMKNRADLLEKLRVLEDGLKELDAFTARPDSSTRLSV
ncbi:Interferon-induced GTP-binding protein Mx1 [Cytospora mali]|uniref:Interferon-induced GTP-binding protein Mx1 n=1 Tax=Cytospora mali TaxID=578113 RepID=A0A194W088_CYTMA|nr:Interferon-induced GTP-binding protein Mx1 [Valsa mali]